MSELYNQIDSIIHPRNIAFVGITTSNPLHWTRTFWNSTRAFDFQGNLYPVNPRGGELDGCRVYRSIDEVPGNIDYVISTVAARTAPEIMKKCAAKGVKGIHFCTAGFAETGSEDVAGLQDELSRLARETGVRIIGPNCMGVYYPKNGLAFRSDMETEPGNIGVISQSGGLAINIVLKGKLTGLKFSKVVSIGNSIDLKPAELLQLFAMDTDTKIIGCYFESLGKTMEESRRLLAILKQTVKKKPVIIWRGGRSERGSIAASSHTGALKTSSQMWDAFVKQSGVISASNFEEFIDTLEAFQFLSNKYPGPRIGLISISGGSAVTATDEIMEAGLEIPMLTKESQKAILDLAVAEVGVSTKNPVDLGNSYFGFSIIEKTVEIILKDPNIDILLFEISTHYIYNATVMSMKEFPDIYFENAIKTVKHARRNTKKPVFIIMPEVAYEAETINNRQVFLKNNIPVFPNVRRAIIALKNLARFAQWSTKAS
ncbi:MAG: CoA-binding protein [Candidatus Sigynarchaeum springense]